MQVLDIKEDFTLRWSLSAYAEPCLHDLSAYLLTHTIHLFTHSHPLTRPEVAQHVHQGQLEGALTLSKAHRVVGVKECSILQIQHSTDTPTDGL